MFMNSTLLYKDKLILKMQSFPIYSNTHTHTHTHMHTHTYIYIYIISIIRYGSGVSWG